MNVVFGSVSQSRDSTVPENLHSAIAEIFGDRAETVFLEQGPPTHTFGALSDGGVIVGHANNEHAALLYIGAISLPSASWRNESSPIDAPDNTARFLLARYLETGKAFLSEVNGQYALAIMDKRSGSLILAADPFGGRTWFVHETASAVTFSSHLFSLAKSHRDTLTVDRSFEDFFLIYGFYPYGRTPYSGIRAMPPGQVAEWDGMQKTTTQIATQNFWADDASASVEKLHSEEEVLNTLYNAMMRATREQLPSKRQRVAVLLGGFDSALIASLIHHLGYPVETYSFHYEDAEFNQPHTDTLASYLGITHHWIPIARSTIEEGIRNFPKTFNQPTNWPNYVLQTAYLCQRIRDDGIRHVYSGDGCDAVFLGYPGTYLRAKIFGSMPPLPAWLHRTLVSLAARPFLEKALGHPYRVALNVLRGLGRTMPARGYLSFRIFDEISLAQLRTEPPPQPALSLDQLVADVSAPFSELPVLRLAYQGKAAVSPNRNKLIGSSDLAGVTILAPYMHPAVKKLALSLPEHLMRPAKETKAKATGKYILMKMAEEKDLLPPSIIYQPKMAAVDGPIDEWYDGPMREMLVDIMRGLPFSYDQGYINRLLDRKLSEHLFKRYVMTDKVISHAASLLATYATFTAITRLEHPE